MRPTPARSAGVLAALSALCIIALSACGTNVAEENDSPVRGKVQKMNVDGTECVIYDADGGGGGLSCDWD